MNKSSRISNSFKNARVALFFYVITLILNFFYRKIFIEHLGVEILGLNTTASNLLQLLNIAELGVGAAISYALYKPLNSRDELQINEIVSVQGYLYKIIGFIILFVGVLFMVLFPWIFQGIQIPLWYTYATFSVLIFASLLSFFVNYQQVVLVSDQNEFKLNYVLQGFKVLKISLQILFISSLYNGYVWWLIIELIFNILTALGIKYMVRREYPWLVTSTKNGRKLIKKYSEITKKTKQLFSHKIAAFALNQSSPLIIFAYSSLAFVAIYGNYLLIIAGVTSLLAAVFNSTNAGVGNLVADGNKMRTVAVFNELFSIRFFFASIAAVSVYHLSPLFISYWVGEKYMIEDSTLQLMVIIMFINLTRLTVDSFINGFGLFNDIKAPIIETILNLGLSILFGKFYGTNGVLAGVIVSLLVVVKGWKPYFLFSCGFDNKFNSYLRLYVKNLVVGIFAFLLLHFIMINIIIDPSKSIYYFILYSLILITSYTTILLVGYLLVIKEMKFFLYRMIGYIKK